jgi:hypothetical protein
VELIPRLIDAMFAAAQDVVNQVEKAKQIANSLKSGSDLSPAADTTEKASRSAHLPKSAFDVVPKPS